MRTICLPAAEQMNLPCQLPPVLNIPAGVYSATLNNAPVILAVLSDGRYWIVLEEGLADPHVLGRVGAAVSRLDPVAIGPTASASDRSPPSEVVRVLPFRPPRAAALR